MAEHEHEHGHGHGHGAAEPARPDPAPPPAWEPCRRPTGYERRLGAILLEVYQPWLLLAVKLPPVAVLRIGKTIALVFTEGVGRAVCCWGAGESRLLDVVGLGTAALAVSQKPSTFSLAVFPARFFALMNAWYTRQRAGLPSSSSLPRLAFFRGVIAPLIAAASGAAPEQKSVRHLAVAAVIVHRAHNCGGRTTGRRRGWGFCHVFLHSVSSTVPP